MTLKAVVISEDHYNALGMVRSLGEANIDVYLILTTSEKRTYVDKSKYVKCFAKVDHEEKKVLNAIKEAIENSKGRETVIGLFPLSDYAACIIDENREVLSQDCVIVPHMHGNMKDWQDKEKSKHLASQNEIRVPESTIVYLSSNESVKWDIFPAIIKPLISVEGAKSHITVVDTKEELVERLNWFKEHGYARVLVEEYINGENEYMIEVLGYVCEKDVHISGIVKKIREYPYGRGSTSYAQIVASIPDLNVKKIQKYITELGFNGLFDMEFKHANGSTYFIECNYRNGAPGYALTCAGENIPAQWFYSNIGNIYTASNKQIDNVQYFMCEQTDILNVLKGRVKLIDWIKEKKKANCIFAVKGDMRPAKTYYLLFIKAMVAVIWRRIKSV